MTLSEKQKMDKENVDRWIKKCTPSLLILIRDYLWWKAYHWVFSVKYDIRWQTVHDKLNKCWQEGYNAGRRSRDTF